MTLTSDIDGGTRRGGKAKAISTERVHVARAVGLGSGAEAAGFQVVTVELNKGQAVACFKTEPIIFENPSSMTAHINNRKVTQDRGA